MKHTGNGSVMAGRIRTGLLGLSALVLAITQTPTPAQAQTPIPAQGRDTVNSVYRVLKVDAQGQLYTVNSGGGGGCVGTIGTPCVVQGVDASGASATARPVLIGGTDGTNARSLKTDANGQLIPSTASTANADGVSNTQLAPAGPAGALLYQRDQPYWFNGSTWDRQFACNLSQAIAVSAAADVRIVSGSGSTKVRICHISFSGDTTAVVTLRQGTQMTTACDTGTATMTGGYQNTVALALDFNAESALTATAGNDVCIHFSTAVTAGGVVNYAQF